MMGIVRTENMKDAINDMEYSNILCDNSLTRV